MQGRWIVFAGGGTGGHLYPAMSVVEFLRERGEPADVSFFCTEKVLDREILEAARIDAVPQVVLPFPAKPWLWPRFLLAWRQAVSFCTHRFKARRPTVVIGAGGYASGPPVHAAARLGIPTFLLNPDAVPGRANQHMAARGRVSGIFAQWEVTRQYFPPHVRVEVTGCPVRKAFRQSASMSAATARASFGLEAEKPTLLVTGASQGARTINQAMRPLAGVIATAGWQVLHLSGAADEQQVRKAYADCGAKDLRSVVLAFTERMAEAMAASDVIISRAGASTLSEIQAAGKPSILFPYPYHRDQHQRHNAAVLADAGAAVLLDDRKDAQANAAQLAPNLSLLMGDARRCEMMGAAARRLDRPDAAQAIAGHLLKVGAQP